MFTPSKVVENVQLPANNLKRNFDMEVGSGPLRDMVGAEVKLSRDIEELKSKLIAVDSELNQVSLIPFLKFICWAIFQFAWLRTSSFIVWGKF